MIIYLLILAIYDSLILFAGSREGIRRTFLVKYTILGVKTQFFHFCFILVLFNTLTTDVPLI